MVDIEKWLRGVSHHNSESDTLAKGLERRSAIHASVDFEEIISQVDLLGGDENLGEDERSQSLYSINDIENILNEVILTDREDDSESGKSVVDIMSQIYLLNADISSSSEDLDSLVSKTI